MKFRAFVGMRLPADVVKAAKQQAKAEDRTLSSYFRRIIAVAVLRRATEEQGRRRE